MPYLGGNRLWHHQLVCEEPYQTLAHWLHDIAVIFFFREVLQK